MKLHKVTFTNREGQKLVGRLEMPVDRHAHNMAIFAHCFTCTKNLAAVKNISKGLTSQGFGVLRFDFTGLGESEGDFAETNFSGNVGDLVAAAKFLKEQLHVTQSPDRPFTGRGSSYLCSFQNKLGKGSSYCGSPLQPNPRKTSS